MDYSIAKNTLQVEFDEYFVSGTRKALYPSQFGDPAEDCNCRFNALKRSRSKMNADELKVLKERAEFFGLDKTEDFKEFEKKYLKASKSIENSDNYGIIKEKNKSAIGIQFFANKGILKQKDHQLEKSIKSWEDHIELHKLKISNPAQYDIGWNSKTDEHKAGLLRHWQHEIDTSEANIKAAHEELERRRKT